MSIKSLKFFIVPILEVFGCLMLFSCPVYAEFLTVNPLVRHITSHDFGTGGVVILPATPANGGATGLLIYTSTKSIPAQAFNTNVLTNNDSHMFFLRFDRTKRRFSELVIVGGRSFALEGNITIESDNIKVAVINDGDKEAYTSIFYKGDKSLIAFLGLQQIISTGGTEAVRWLDAGTDAASEVLTLNANQQLLVGGMPYEGKKVGLPSQNAQTVCGTNGIVFRSQASANTSTNVMKNKERSGDFFQKHVVLLSKREGLVVQDGYGQLLTVTSKNERTSDDRIICIYEPLI